MVKDLVVHCLKQRCQKKPVIASNWSGHTDFLSTKLAVRIEGHLTDVPKEAFPKDMYVPGSKWFTVNYQQTSAILKDVFTNYKKYRFNAEKLTMGNKSKFSLEAMTEKLGKILDKYVPEFPKEVELNLPKLKKVQSKATKLPEMKLPKLKRL